MLYHIDHHESPMPPDYYERKYGVSRTTLSRYRKAGLPALRVGAKIFIRDCDFVAFLRRMNRQKVEVAK